MPFDFKAFLAGVFLMVLGSGLRSFGIKIPGELLIFIGIFGITATISYGKFYTANVIANPYFLLFSFSSIVLILSIMLYRHHADKTKEENAEETPAPLIKIPIIDTQNYFPRLNLDVLKEFAKRFVKKHFELPVTNITLYRYHYEKSSDDKQKYALVYEVDSKVKQSDILRDKIVELQEQSGWIGGSDSDMEAAKKFGIDAGFADLYIETAPEDYFKEWNFYLKTTDEKMPIGIMVEEKSLVLYQTTT